MLVGPALLVLAASAAGAIILVVAIASAILSVLVLARLAGMVRHLNRDIERRKTLETQLAFQAFHVPLTALPNRRRFLAGVRDALARPDPVAALFIDLDDFKHVNDNLGHDAGDAFLLAVADRIVASVRPGDLVSRLGGDEFAVLLESVDDAIDAEEVATRLVEAFQAPIAIKEHRLPGSVSVGLAFRLRGERVSADALLRRADVAMYHAKARGKNQRTSYAESMETAERSMPPLVGRGAPA
jgi:diguanylate cyclase (GGDEF)-like protein